MGGKRGNIGSPGWFKRSGTEATLPRNLAPELWGTLRSSVRLRGVGITFSNAYERPPLPGRLCPRTPSGVLYASSLLPPPIGTSTSRFLPVLHYLDGTTTSNGPADPIHGEGIICAYITLSFRLLNQVKLRFPEPRKQILAPSPAGGKPPT